MFSLAQHFEIHLDVNRFADDAEVFEIAKVVSAHAEASRSRRRGTEKPVRVGLIEQKEGYWSDTVSWYEWMTEPQILEACAQECGLKIWELAEIIAYRMSPDNWQVFSWMSLALRREEYQEILTGALSASLGRMEETRAEIQAKARTEFARAGAKAMLADDPKQKEKAEVRQCWEEWQRQPNRYKGKAAFARDMREKYENLKSQPVIEGWCRTWQREAETVSQLAE